MTIFGIEMGTGWRTFSPTVLPHVFAILIMFLGGSGELTGGCFGFVVGRAMAVPLHRVARLAPVASRLTMSKLVEATTGVAMIVALLDDLSARALRWATRGRDVAIPGARSQARRRS